MAEDHAGASGVVGRVREAQLPARTVSPPQESSRPEEGHRRRRGFHAEGHLLVYKLDQASRQGILAGPRKLVLLTQIGDQVIAMVGAPQALGDRSHLLVVRADLAVGRVKRTESNPEALLAQCQLCGDFARGPRCFPNERLVKVPYF
jgi:hypothetical protein